MVYTSDLSGIPSETQKDSSAESESPRGILGKLPPLYATGMFPRDSKGPLTELREISGVPRFTPPHKLGFRGFPEVTELRVARRCPADFFQKTFFYVRRFFYISSVQIKKRPYG